MPIFTILVVHGDGGRRAVTTACGLLKAIWLTAREVWYYVKSKSNDGIKLEVFVL